MSEYGCAHLMAHQEDSDVYNLDDFNIHGSWDSEVAQDYRTMYQLGAIRRVIDSARMIGGWRFQWYIIAPRQKGQYLIVRLLQLGVTGM